MPVPLPTSGAQIEAQRLPLPGLWPPWGCGWADPAPVASDAGRWEVPERWASPGCGPWGWWPPAGSLRCGRGLEGGGAAPELSKKRRALQGGGGWRGAGALSPQVDGSAAANETMASGNGDRVCSGIVTVAVGRGSWRRGQPSPTVAAPTVGGIQLDAAPTPTTPPSWQRIPGKGRGVVCNRGLEVHTFCIGPRPGQHT